jgi:AraC-like DNA-binding protein
MVGLLAAEALFDRLPDVVFFEKDRLGRYRRANATLVERCGKKYKSEVLGHTAAELFPGALGIAYSEQDREVLSTGITIEGRLELHLYPGGHEGWCLTYKTPLRSRTGAVVGLVGISRDVHRPDSCHPEYESVARAIEAIQSGFDDALRLKSLARRVGLSMDRFERLVKQLFQLTPNQLLVKTRIDAASRMLRDETLAIAEVAHACGYGDHSAFTRQFRAAVGLTPRAFRARHGTHGSIGPPRRAARPSR